MGSLALFRGMTDITTTPRNAHMRTYTAGIGSRILLLGLLLLVGGSVVAQREAPLTTGQMDPSGLTGSWKVRTQEDGVPDEQLLGEYWGLPVNDEARARGDAWQSSYQEM